MVNCKAEIIDFLRHKPTSLDVVVMPDFFLDRLISLHYKPSRFSAMIEAVAQRKGGSIDGITQRDTLGGNAVNVAAGLAALGAEVCPIVCTSRLGLELMNFHLKPYGVDTSHVKIRENASVTTALELEIGDGKANVMLRDLGSLADFGPDDLGEEDYELVDRADYVCIFNWAGTRRHGTKLAETVFQRVKKAGKGKTYCDTADPTPNKEEIPQLMEKVLKTDKVDILSLNENEALTYASFFDKALTKTLDKLCLYESAKTSARTLENRLSARIDLHTTSYSATFLGKEEVVVPAFKVETFRVTGAGDAWDAANIFADGSGLSDECRLLLANAASACYLSDREGRHPTRQRLISFLKNVSI